MWPVAVQLSIEVRLNYAGRFYTAVAAQLHSKVGYGAFQRVPVTCAFVILAPNITSRGVSYRVPVTSLQFLPVEPEIVIFDVK